MYVYIKIQFTVTISTNKFFKKDITTYLLKWLKLKRQAMLSIGDNIGSTGSIFTVDENIKCFNHFGKKLGNLLNI